MVTLLNKSVEPLSPSVLEFANLKTASKVEKFHHSISGYKPTPLVNLSQLAKRLDVKNIFVKDESHRFDLNSFKVLGASYAIAKYLAEKLELKSDELEFNKIIAYKSKYENITFVTATDGNHGRAVAWVEECATPFAWLRSQ